MERALQVHVVKFAGRAFQLQWRDPETDRIRTKSSKTRIRREAERAAVALEKEISEGLHTGKGCTWEQFRDRCDEYTGKNGKLAPKSKGMISATLGQVTGILAPKRPDDIDARAVERFKAGLLEQKRSMATVKSYTGQLRTLLNWGKDMGWIAKVPKFGTMKQTKSKGRAITGEEFDRMTYKVSAVVGEAAAPSWRHLLRGLWLTGLRLGEAVALSWEPDAAFAVCLSGRRPVFRIAGAQKNGKYQDCPMVPDAAEFLLATPEGDRRGRVFRPMRKDGDDSPMREDTASKVICAIGKKAGVVVAKNPNGKVKFASAHDLRRSFGTRWAPRVKQVVLMQLMRHANIGTTMSYYVDLDAQATAELLWADHDPAGANSFANSAPKTTETEEARNDVSRDSVTAY
jgi:integrase